MSSQTIDHRLNLAVSNLSINTHLAPADYQQIRDMKAAGKGIMEVSKCMAFDRDQVSAIFDGLVHKTEYDNMSPSDQLKFRETYLRPRIEKKMESEKSKKTLTNDEYTESVNMTNSINKRIVKDLNTIIEILLYKFKINPATNKLFTQKEALENIRLISGAEKATISTIANIWNGDCTIYDREFLQPSKINKSQYEALTAEVRGRKTDLVKIANIVKNNNIGAFV